MSARFFTGSLAGALLLMLAGPALAEGSAQWFATDGEDTYQIAGSAQRTQIVYAGSQRLTVEHRGGDTRFTATVTYERRESGNAKHVTAVFVSTIRPDGEQLSATNDDPDYLTILNQPFAIELDAPTFHDLQTLKRTVPFDFPSPMTGAPLHGSLRRLTDGTINGKRVLGIAFIASGPLDGSLPDRPAERLRGTITMNGAAYYAYANAQLTALEATLQIAGRVANDGHGTPVTVVYKRTIRPQAP